MIFQRTDRPKEEAINASSASVFASFLASFFDRGTDIDVSGVRNNHRDDCGISSAATCVSPDDTDFSVSETVEL